MVERTGGDDGMIQKFEFHTTKLPGLIEVVPFNADDIRGSFTKDYSKEVFEANGIRHDLAEVFYTTSHKGVIRAEGETATKAGTVYLWPCVGCCSGPAQRQPDFSGVGAF